MSKRQEVLGDSYSQEQDDKQIILITRKISGIPTIKWNTSTRDNL